jgi:predicted amidophosphoribosyltransferase
MSNKLSLSKLKFGSLLSYSPHGNSEYERKAKNAMLLIKGDKFFGNPPVLMSRFISELILKNIGTLPFAHFFDTQPILVPIPNSSLMKENSLWVPQRIATALHEKGYGIGVADMLRRVRHLPKAATSLSEKRPKATNHHTSLEIQDILTMPKNILLIDDVITRGATLMGAANKLNEKYPGVNILAFSAMRAEDFHDVYDPCVGEIILSGENTFRHP